MKENMEDKLIDAALKVAKRKELKGFPGNNAGEVGAALITKDGHIYTGICLVITCGLGFCAEASAIAEMLKNKETEIEMIVAITDKGKIIPPCGRCRELLMQIDKNNLNTLIIMPNKTIKKLSELLPDIWVDYL